MEIKTCANCKHHICKMESTTNMGHYCNREKQDKYISNPIGYTCEYFEMDKDIDFSI